VKFTYMLDGLGCAACATKMERMVSKIKGVESASVVFMSQRLIVHAEEPRIEEIDDEIEKIVKKVSCDAVSVRR
jgi:cation transport ATPase